MSRRNYEGNAMSEQKSRKPRVEVDPATLHPNWKKYEELYNRQVCELHDEWKGQPLTTAEEIEYERLYQTIYGVPLTDLWMAEWVVERLNQIAQTAANAVRAGRR
jgi:hypothetical protein